MTLPPNHHDTILIYFEVDCKLGPYLEGSCSATCGTSAVKTKTRQVVQKAAYGGKECEGTTKITENCGLSPCPSMTQIDNFYFCLNITF